MWIVSKNRSQPLDDSQQSYNCKKLSSTNNIYGLSIFFFFFWPWTACGILVPQPGIEPASLAIKAWTGPPGISFSGLWSEVKVAQSCPTLCNPMDYTVHGIFHAKILEWVAFPFSRGSSQPRDWTQVSRVAGRLFTSWATVWKRSILQSLQKQMQPGQHLNFSLMKPRAEKISEIADTSDVWNGEQIDGVVLSC